MVLTLTVVTCHIWCSQGKWLLIDDGTLYWDGYSLICGTHRVHGYSLMMVLTESVVTGETWYSCRRWFRNGMVLTDTMGHSSNLVLTTALVTSTRWCSLPSWFHRKHGTLRAIGYSYNLVLILRLVCTAYMVLTVIMAPQGLRYSLGAWVA
jgi:hypothetical protein